MGLRAGLDWCGKSRLTGIRSAERPARRQSLYRLRYPAHTAYVLTKTRYHSCNTEGMSLSVSRILFDDMKITMLTNLKPRIVVVIYGRFGRLYIVFSPFSATKLSYTR